METTLYFADIQISDLRNIAFIILIKSSNLISYRLKLF